MKKLALIVGSVIVVAAIAAVVYRYFGYDEDNIGGDDDEEEDEGDVDDELARADKVKKDVENIQPYLEEDIDS